MTDKYNRKLLLTLLLLIVCGAILHNFQYSGHFVDDAFITYRYAENLAAGKGLTYNPPQQLEGYSNFLLVGILAITKKLGMEIPLTAKVVGLISYVTLIILLFRFEEEYTGKGYNSVISPALAACSIALAWWSAAGLETLLYTLLVTLAVYFSIKKDLNKNQLTTLALLLMLIVICRTDGALFAMLVAISFVGIRRKDLTGSNKQASIAVVTSTVIAIALFHGFRYLWFGTLLSAPAIAKQAGAIHPLSEGVKYCKGFFFGSLPPLSALAVIFSLCKPTRLTLPLSLLVSGQIGVSLWIGGDWMVLYRHFVPFLPLLFVETSRLLRELTEWNKAMRLPSALLLGLTLYGVLVPGNVRTMEIQRYKGFHLLTKTVGTDLKNYPKDSVVVAGDIGVIGFESKMAILDMKGLVTPWICATYKVVKEDNHLMTTFDADVLFDKKPDLVLVAVYRIKLSQAEVSFRNGQQILDLSRVQGFWASDTTLLQSQRLLSGYILRKQYPGGKDCPLDYLLFQRKTQRMQ